METLTLTPNSKPLYQVQPQHSHPRLSLRRVLWIKFLRWLDKATFYQLRKLTVRSFLVVAITVTACTPSFALGVFLSTWRVAGIEASTFALVAYLVFYGRPLLRRLRRLRRTSGGSNQHTFHGVPVGALASYLIEHGAFKRDESMKKLGLTQGQYARMAKQLFDAGVLFKGEQNAFTLREIRMEDLVRQLRDGFPLVWSEERQTWAERNGTFEQWCLSHDFKRRKLAEEIERKEKRKKRLDRQIRERQEYKGALANVFAHATA